MGGDERTRQEPRIDPGEWDRLRFRDSEAPPPPPRVPAWRSRSTWRWVAVAVLAIALLLIVFRQPLANILWPDTRIQKLLDQGNAALKAGQLGAGSQAGARQYFEAALALDNDRGEARAGLARVAQAAVVRASRATDRGDHAEAHAQLQLATDLQAPRLDIERVAARLRVREARESGIDTWLEQARAAQAAGQLDGTPDAALPIYQRILSLQPNRVEALEGREDALSDVLQQARAQLDQGRLAEGGVLIANVRRYDPGHVDLPETEAALTRAIERMLARADRDRARGNLDEATHAYQAIAIALPDDPRPAAGLERMAAAYADKARRDAADFQFERAQVALAQARVLSPQLPAIAEVERSMERSRVRQHQAGFDATLSPRMREARLARYLSAMSQAETRGDWITPPGESAYDALRAAQALAPDDRRVRTAASRLLPAVQNCFEQEWLANRVRRAQGCLAAWQALRPGDSSLPAARRRMAQKWIAVGTERLGAGDIAFATQAMSEARAMDANAPGLEAFAERVRLARPTTP